MEDDTIFHKLCLIGHKCCKSAAFPCQPCEQGVASEATGRHHRYGVPTAASSSVGDAAVGVILGIP
jgi:hypothetical protein